MKDTLADAMRNWRPHDGSDCDLAVDEDAERLASKLAERGWSFAPPGSVVLDPDEAKAVQKVLVNDVLLPESVWVKLSRQEAPE